MEITKNCEKVKEIKKLALSLEKKYEEKSFTKKLINRYFDRLLEEKIDDKLLRIILFDTKYYLLDVNYFFDYIDTVSYLIHKGYSFKRIRSIFLSSEYFDKNILRKTEEYEFPKSYLHFLYLYSQYIPAVEKLEYSFKNLNYLVYETGKKFSRYEEIKNLVFYLRKQKYPKENILELLDKTEKEILNLDGIFDGRDEIVEKIKDERKWMERELVVDDSHFSFIIPSDVNMIYDEAEELRICIKSRLREYVQGKWIYVFMRDSQKIENPLVSIIIDTELNKIAWAVGKYHKNVEGIQKKAVDEFYKQVFGNPIAS